MPPSDSAPNTEDSSPPAQLPSSPPGRSSGRAARRRAEAQQRQGRPMPRRTDLRPSPAPSSSWAAREAPRRMSGPRSCPKTRGEQGKRQGGRSCDAADVAGVVAAVSAGDVGGVIGGVAALLAVSPGGTTSGAAHRLCAQHLQCPRTGKAVRVTAGSGNAHTGRGITALAEGNGRVARTRCGSSMWEPRSLRRASRCRASASQRTLRSSVSAGACSWRSRSSSVCRIAAERSHPANLPRQSTRRSSTIKHA